MRVWHRTFGKDKAYYRAFRKMFGVTPDNIELYKLALVHRSASIRLEDGSMVNNERLEFLGDAVLETVVSDYLFIEYPDYTEGSLTQLRSKIVSRASVNAIAIDLGLENLVISHSGGSFVQKHIYGNALEALFGALYLDKGYNTVNRIVINHLLPEYIDIEDVSQVENDYKSRLIEWCQKSKRTIRFATESDGENGSSQHPAFLSRVIIDDMKMGSGRGSTKKEAEQQAAHNAWELLGDEMGDYILDRYDHLSNEITKR
jgi:ribonuclease-3